MKIQGPARAVPKIKGTVAVRARELDGYVLDSARVVASRYYDLYVALGEIRDRRLWEALGFPSLSSYLYERLGRGERWLTLGLIWVRKCERFPQLRQAVEAGRITPRLSQDVARFVNEDDVEAVLAKVEGKSFRAAVGVLRHHRLGQDPKLNEQKQEGWYLVAGYLPASTWELWKAVLEKARIITGSDVFAVQIEAVLIAADAEIASTYPGLPVTAPPPKEAQDGTEDPPY